MVRWTRFWFGVCALLVNFVDHVAHAQETPARPAALAVDPATRASARQLAGDAMALYDKNDCIGAVEKFSRAHELVQAPTLALYAGKCMEKLGRLVEASEWYRVAGVDPLEPGNAKLAKAQEDAATLRSALQARIPTVVLSLERPAPDAEVRLDGRPLPVAALGLERPIDPGRHVAEVQRGRIVVPRGFTVQEGEHVQLALEVTLAATARAPAGTGLAPPAAPTGPLEAGSASPGPWIVGGAGLASLVIGAVTGGVAIHEHTINEAGCSLVMMTCMPPGKSAATTGRIVQAVSVTALVAGGVGVAGSALWFGLRSPSRRTPPSIIGVAVGPLLGGAAVRLEGSW